GQFGTQTGITSPLSLTAVPAPNGTFRAMLDQAHLQPLTQSGRNLNAQDTYEGSHALYQDITIPAGITEAKLSLNLYYNNSNSHVGSSPPFFAPTGLFSDATANPLLDYRTGADNQQIRI